MLYLTQLLKRTSDNSPVMYLGEIDEKDKNGNWQSKYLTANLEEFNDLSIYHQDDENLKFDYVVDEKGKKPFLVDAGFFGFVNLENLLEMFEKEKIKKFILGD